MSAQFPTSLLSAVRYFSDLKVCNAYLASMKWPNGEVCCPRCGCTSVGKIESRQMFQCKAKECRKQFSVKVGTIFEDSPLGLDKWMVAVWSITNAKNGISSHELARALDVTQKTAWFMLHRIRLAMRSPGFGKLCGEVEGDETFIGGKAANMHKKRREQVIKGRGTIGKVVVQGLMERGGEVRAKVVKNQKRKTLHSIIHENVEVGSHVYTDALRSYEQIKGYVHSVIDHAVAYVDGRVHTNSMENFWSCLKRTIGGTYVCVSPEHLDRYLDEQTMRFNARKENDSTRFEQVMRGAPGRRITYKTLIGKEA